MSKIISISGKMGSGKTTLMNMLGEVLSKKYTVSNVIFANTIYRIHDYAYGILRQNGVKMPENFVKDGPFLQYLGTEWGRKNFGNDVWVECLKGEIAKLASIDHGKEHLFIVSDCRFKNEFDGLPAFRIRLEAPKEVRKARCSNWRENDTHPSEVDLDSYAREGRFHHYIDSETSYAGKDWDYLMSHIGMFFELGITSQGLKNFDAIQKKYYV